MTLRREAFLDHVRECGEYETLQEAERASRVKLALVGEVRAQLAARPPEEFALILLNPLQNAEPLSPQRFVRATAAWAAGRRGPLPVRRRVGGHQAALEPVVRRSRSGSRARGRCRLPRTAVTYEPVP
ncbi:hypothetical protein ABTX71_33795 [Streptomyces parvulus]|uniref:hypothetical protein n=1 Tax=Streptomyces parvulus TaxID=146923 RepID=UPI0033298A56